MHEAHKKVHMCQGGKSGSPYFGSTEVPRSREKYLKYRSSLPPAPLDYYYLEVEGVNILESCKPDGYPAPDPRTSD